MLKATLTKKMYFTFGLLLSLFLITGIIIFNEVQIIIKDMHHLADMVEPRSYSAHEMAIHEIGTEIGILNYLFNPDTDAENIDENDLVFTRHFNEYKNLAVTMKEKNLCAKIEDIHQELIPVGQSLMLTRDYQTFLFSKIAECFEGAKKLFDKMLSEIPETRKNEDNEKWQTLIKMKACLSDMGNWHSNYLRTGNRAYLNDVSESASEFLFRMTRYSSFRLTFEELALMNGIKNIFSSIHFLISETVGIEYAFNTYLNKFSELRSGLSSTIHDEVMNLTQRDFNRAKEETINTARRARYITVSIFLLATLFGGYLLIFLTGYITRSVKHLVNSTEKFGKGQLSERVKIKSNDEIGMLGEAFNNMAEDIEKYIKEKDEVEHFLRESEEKYRNLFENTGTATLVVEEDMYVSHCNTEFEKLLEYSRSEIIRVMKVTDFVSPADREMIESYHYKRRKDPLSTPSNYEFSIVTKHGNKKSVYVQVGLVPGTKKSIASIIDITGQKVMEEQLLQAHKLEAIGTLAGGIAHDFNNLLTGIGGNASLMLLKTGEDEPNYPMLKSIEKCVKSGSELTKQLLGFARKGKYEVRPCNLNEIILQSAEMFGRTRKQVKIETDFNNNLQTVEIDEVQIEQVLLNLFVNSWQAMPEGGELIIRTDNVFLKEEYVSVFGLKSGAYVSLSVTDTGIGMDLETQKRIFDPFYTTKSPGRGTGLGLASTYGIIKNHDGIIEVESEVGRGTTFTIFFPASGKNIPERTVCDDPVVKGTEKILLVDDEEMIISIEKEMLTEMGYEVATADSGEMALDIFKSNPEHIDLIVLDLIMPGMGGAKAYEKIKKIKPSTKVLLASGYNINDRSIGIIKDCNDAFIQKPFSMMKLSQKIREILA